MASPASTSPQSDPQSDAIARQITDDLETRLPLADFRDYPDATIEALKNIKADPNVTAASSARIEPLVKALSALQGRMNNPNFQLTAENYRDALGAYVRDVANVSAYWHADYEDTFHTKHPYDPAVYRPGDKGQSAPGEEATPADGNKALQGRGIPARRRARDGETPDPDGNVHTLLFPIGDPRGRNMSQQKGVGQPANASAPPPHAPLPPPARSASVASSPLAAINAPEGSTQFEDEPEEETKVVKFAKAVGTGLKNNWGSILFSLTTSLVFGPLGIVAGTAIAGTKHTVKALNQEYKSQFENAAALSAEIPSLGTVFRNHSGILFSRDFWATHGREIGKKTAISGAFSFVAGGIGHGIHEFNWDEMGKWISDDWDPVHEFKEIFGGANVPEDTLNPDAEPSDINEPAGEAAENAQEGEGQTAEQGEEPQPQSGNEDEVAQTGSEDQPAQDTNSPRQQTPSNEPGGEGQPAQHSNPDAPDVDLEFGDRIERYVKMVEEHYPTRFDDAGDRGQWAMEALKNYSADSSREGVAWQVLELVYESNDPELVKEASEIVKMLGLDASHHAMQLAEHNEAYAAALETELNTAIEGWGELANSDEVGEISRKRLQEIVDANLDAAGKANQFLTQEPN